MYASRFSIFGRNSRNSFLIGILIAASAFVWYPWSGRPAADRDRVYRIGWAELPPLEVSGPGGEPTGLVVELIRNAAKRAGVRLRWVAVSPDPETALLGGTVDLWAILTITPDRLNRFHITEPLLETEHCLLGLETPGGGVTRVGTSNPRLDSALIQGMFPNARILPRASVRDLIADLCDGSSDAAYMNEYSALAALVDGRKCDGRALRWYAAPGGRSSLGIGSTFESKAVADALRKEVGAFAARNELRSIAGKWGYLSSNLESIAHILDSRHRETQVRAAAAFLTAGLLAGLLLLGRVRSERNRTRAAEKALGAAERRLRLMADNLHETVVAFDMERRLLYANPAYEKLTGYPVSEMAKRVESGQGMFQYIDEGRRGEIRERFLAAFRGESMQDQEYPVAFRDGEKKWASFSWGPICDAAGIQIGVHCTGRDITARKVMEEKLRQTSMRLETLLNNSPLAVIEFAFDHTVVNWLGGAERLFGWTAGEVIGKNVLDFKIVHEDDWPEVRRAMSAMNAGLPWLSRNRNYRKDGSVVYCEWYNSVLPSGDGGPAAGFSLVLDISHRRQAEEALRISEEKHRNIVESAPVGILQSTLDGRFLSVNPKLASIFGFDSPERMIAEVGNISADLFVKPERRREIIREALERPGYVRQEVDYRGRDGSVFVANLYIRVERDSRGAPALLEGFVEDITERKRAEEELRAAHDELEERVRARTMELSEANRRLQELDRLKSVFLASMSHELRTPLNSIIGFAGLLRQELSGPVNAEQKKQLDIIRGSSRHLLSLINDLLDVSRIEAGRADLVFEPFDFCGVAAEAAQSLTALADSKGLKLLLDIPPEGIEMVSDRKRTLQLLINLINNAIKFTAKGHVKISAKAAGADLRVSVEDTGIGIKPEHIGMLFEAFRQVDGSARRVYEGTGLGLYLCRKILELLGGRIGVTSEFGVGARFEFSMPLRRAAAAEPVPSGFDALGAHI